MNSRSEILKKKESGCGLNALTLGFLLKLTNELTFQYSIIVGERISLSITRTIEN